MRKIKILGVAPFESMMDTMMVAGKGRMDIEIDVILMSYTPEIKSLSDYFSTKNADLLRMVNSTHYDAIISRGGAARILDRVNRVPTIDIPFSAVDIIRTLREAQGTSGRIAVVGFPSLIDTTYAVCKTLQLDIALLTADSASDTIECIKSLRDRHYDTIIGGSTAVSIAQSLGMKAFLVNSSVDSVSIAIDMVIEITNMVRKERETSEYFKTLLANSDTAIMAYLDRNSLVFSHVPDNLCDTGSVAELLTRYVKRVLSVGELSLIKTIDGNMFSITGKNIDIGGDTHAVFYLKKIATNMMLKHGAMSIRNFDDMGGQLLELYIEGSPYRQNMEEQIRQLLDINTPTLVVGEKGTGTDAFVSTICMSSNRNMNPVVIVDCGLMDKKQWKSLLGEENSIFAQSGHSVYFRGIQNISPLVQKQLSSYISLSMMAKRNRLIFSCDREEHVGQQLLQYLRDEANCHILRTIPLSARVSDIPRIVHLISGNYDILSGKMETRFSEEALQLLSKRTWLQNVDQLKQCVTAILQKTSSTIITEEEVLSLMHEKSIESNGFEYVEEPLLDLSKSLDEITRDIIIRVLHEEGMNQTRAAKRLGINRSTMWRKLKM